MKNFKQQFTVSILLVWMTFNSYSQDKNNFKIGCSAGLNASFSKYPTGYYNSETNEEILIRGGGIGSMNLFLGYDFFRRFEWLISIGFLADGPDLDNGEISYWITEYNTTLKFNLLNNEKRKLFIGGGLAYYCNPELIIDGSKVQGGDKSEYYYENSLGPMFVISYERVLSKRLSFLFNINNTYNNFDLSQSSVNETYVPIDNLEEFKKSNYSKINANNLTFHVGLAFKI